MGNIYHEEDDDDEEDLDEYDDDYMDDEEEEEEERDEVNNEAEEVNDDDEEEGSGEWEDMDTEDEEEEEQEEEEKEDCSGGGNSSSGSSGNGGSLNLWSFTSRNGTHGTTVRARKTALDKLQPSTILDREDEEDEDESDEVSCIDFYCSWSLRLSRRICREYSFPHLNVSSFELVSVYVLMEFITNALENASIIAELETVVVDCEIKLHQATTEVAGVQVLGFDCEGVDLGRFGKICIVQLSTRTKCFLFDVKDLDKESVIVLFLKSILENPSVTKVIHDCKMDSDALYHLLDIKLCNSHDTQVWDTILFNRGKGSNLNQTLSDTGCTINSARRPNIYHQDNAFWAKRPLTKHMIAWAAGDVSSLFELYEKQLAMATVETSTRCRMESERNEAFLRECLVHVSRKRIC